MKLPSESTVVGIGLAITIGGYYVMLAIGILGLIWELAK